MLPAGVGLVDDAEDARTATIVRLDLYDATHVAFRSGWRYLLIM